MTSDMMPDVLLEQLLYEEPAQTEEPVEDTMHGRYLSLLSDGKQFAIAFTHVVDIIEIQPITRVPNCPDFVRGVTNLRGKVIPIMDLRIRFGRDFLPYTDRTCIVVLEERGSAVGLVVDKVSEVLTLTDEQIAPPPSFIHGLDTRYVEGVGKSESGVVLILNCAAVLDDEMLDFAQQ